VLAVTDDRPNSTVLTRSAFLGRAVDTLRSKVYVAAAGRGQVAILDGQTNALVTNQGSIPDVHAMAGNPLTKEFYALGMLSA
jgi:DNA-binding beta-propeller fold protein YncE